MEHENLSLSLEEIPVKYLKMMNGDSIISYVYDNIYEDGSVIALEDPMIVTIDEDCHYQFSPWFPFSKKNIHFIDIYNIMTEDDIDNDVKSTYIKLVLDKISSDFGMDNSSTRH